MPISSVDNSSHKVLDLGKTPLSLLATLQVKIEQLSPIGLVRRDLDGPLGGNDEDGAVWLTLKGEEALTHLVIASRTRVQSLNVVGVASIAARAYDHGLLSSPLHIATILGKNYQRPPRRHIAYRWR